MYLQYAVVDHQESRGSSTPVDIAIHVPTQSIHTTAALALAEERVEKTSRNLTLKDLLSHANHPSAAMRKDALLGMMELMDAFPSSMVRALAVLVRGTAKLIVDADRSVRKTLLQFYAQHLFLQQQELGTSILVQDAILRPHFPTLLVYTSSAMTHILEDIRLDALQFLSLWLERYPQMTVQFGSAKILPHFLNLLGCASMSAADSKASAPGYNAAMSASSPMAETSLSMSAHRLEVLSKLTVYVETALQVASSGTAKGTSVDHSSSTVLTELCWKDTEVLYNGSAILLDGQLHPLYGEGASLLDSAETLQSLLTVLQPVLLHLWIEGCPDVFEVARIRSSASLDALVCVLKLLHRLWRSYLAYNSASTSASLEPPSAWIQAQLTPLLKYVHPRFPFGSHVDPSSMDAKAAIALREMNGMYANTMAGFLAHLCKQSLVPGGTPVFPPWTKHLLEYAHTILQSDAPSLSNLSQSDMKCLLELTDQLLQISSQEQQCTLLLHLFRLFPRISPRTPIRKQVFHFLRHLTNLHYQRGHALFTHSAKVWAEVESWLAGLPRYLWELKSEDPETTASIVQLLLVSVRAETTTTTAATTTSSFLDRLRSVLIPCFQVSVKGRAVFGPFVNLPLTVQRMLISLVWELSVVTNEQGTEQQNRLMSAVYACRSHTRILSQPEHASNLFGFLEEVQAFQACQGK